MKMKKFLVILLALIISASMLAFVACGGGDDEEDLDGVYVFEAEHTDLYRKHGGGWSGAGEGSELIQNGSDLGASNGKYIGYAWVEGFTLTFEITSDADTTAKLVVRLAIEGANVVLHANEEFIIKVNGVAINFPDIVFHHDSTPTDGPTQFEDFTIGEIELVEGDNTIELIVGNTMNKIEGGRQDTDNIGPAMDCIKLTTSANLTFNSYEEDNM